MTEDTYRVLKGDETLIELGVCVSPLEQKYYLEHVKIWETIGRGMVPGVPRDWVRRLEPLDDKVDWRDFRGSRTRLGQSQTGGI